MAQSTLMKAEGRSLTALGPHAGERLGLPGEGTQGGLYTRQQAAERLCVPAAGQGPSPSKCEHAGLELALR